MHYQFFTFFLLQKIIQQRNYDWKIGLVSSISFDILLFDHVLIIRPTSALCAGHMAAITTLHLLLAYFAWCLSSVLEPCKYCFKMLPTHADTQVQPTDHFSSKLLPHKPQQQECLCHSSKMCSFPGALEPIVTQFSLFSHETQRSHRLGVGARRDTQQKDEGGAVSAGVFSFFELKQKICSQGFGQT